MAWKRPILVTGAIRSGTTWVGKMIAASPTVGYIREPFGLGRRPGLCGAPFKYWFTFISKENEEYFYEDIKKTVEFRFNGNGRWHSVRSPRAASATAGVYLDYARYRRLNARPLLKDPIGVFSADWLADRFDMDAIVLIRHPAAVASSLKVLKWDIHFDHLLAQPLLMRARLQPFESEIRRMVSEKHDIIDQAALFWKVVYSIVLEYRKEHPNWIYVRHEDLSRDPVTGFRSIFDRLGLDYSAKVEKVIRINSESKDLSDQTRIDQPDSLTRNSLANLVNWKTRLSPSEIERIRVQVEDVSRNFYSDQEWEK
jgi:hypothetical protein